MKTKSLFPILLLILLVILLSLNSEGFPQSQVADSLTRVISRQPENIDKAVNLVNLTKNLLSSKKLDTALHYCEEAFNLSTRLNYIEGQADALYLKSLIYRGKLDLQSSLSYTEKYLELFLLLNDSLRLAKGYYNLGNIHKELGDYELALFYCQKSLSFCIPLQESTLVLANYNCIGSIFFDGKSKYDSAAHYYLKAMEICEQSDNQAHLSTIFNNLGRVYLADNQFEIARRYFSMSLEINQKNGNREKIALNFTNLGRVASEKDDFKEALNYYNQALELYTEIKDDRGIADINNNIGDSYFKQMNYDLALEKFDKALEGYRKIEFSKGIVLASINKASVYSEQGKIKKAMSLQDSCLTIAEQLGGKELLLLAYGNISDNYKKTGNFEKAYFYQLKHNELNADIFDIEKTKAIYAEWLKSEKGKDQARILALEKDNLQKTSQRNAYMFSGLGFVVLALFLVIYFRQKAAHDKIIAQQKIRQLEEEKKLMAAKLLVEGQEEERKRIAMELHDGLGVLLSATKMQFSTIIDNSPENKVLIEKATRMLEQASGDVRKISHNMMPGLLTKLGFFEAVEDLFENIGDTKDMNAICTISGNQDRLSENKEIMLYRIVQEMANNTLKHAEARNIELQIHVLQGMLDMKYSDDGKGFDVGKNLESESIGLKSIQSRVNFLNGTLVIESEPGEGARYSIQIPV